MYSIADGIIFSMEGGRDYIIEKGWDKAHGGSVDLDKVHYINNGVDLEAFEYNRIRFSFSDEHLDNPELFTVVYVGSIRKANHVELIVDTAKLTDISHIRYLIWGDGDHLAELKQRCLDEQITNIVFKGFVEKRKIPSIVSRADINLMNAGNSSALRFGGSQNKLFDYFAAGKPIIQNFYMAYSLVERYDCGMIVEHTPDAMQGAVKKIYDMTESEYARYCANSYKAASEYDYRILAERMRIILEMNHCSRT